MAPAGLAVAAASGALAIPVSPGRAIGHTVPRSAGRGHGPRSVVLHAASTRRVCPARRYRSYTATVSELQRLVKQRPDLAKLWSTQERYGLQSAGVCEGTPCMNWVLEVTDHATLTSGTLTLTLTLTHTPRGDRPRDARRGAGAS